MKCLYSIAVACALMVSALAQQAQPATVHIGFQQYTLANGLRVILSEDHHAPTVSLTVMYDVGSRNEKPGRTGFAHLFEHLMFEGSQNVGKGEYYYYIFNNGGNMNGTTSKDRTVYYESLPANQIDLGLFLESDRMRALSVTQDALDNQRKAVQEERRLSVDNVAYGTTGDVLDATAYDIPAYQHSVIGSMADLNAASLADVTAFYKTYYAPNNAVLVLVGDFAPAAALAKIKKAFEAIPRQAAPPPVDMTQAPQTAERRKTIEDGFAKIPMLNLAYRAPAGNTADWYALDVLGDILAKGRSSRLFEQLVDGKQLANGIAAGPEMDRGPSLFRVQATPRPGHTVAELETAIEASLNEVQQNGVTAAELHKVLNQDRTDLIHADEGTLGVAQALATDQVFFHDPNLINTEIDAYNQVTLADVKRVANQYLVATNRTVLVTEPAAQKAAPARSSGAAPDSKATELSQVVHLGRAPVSKDVLQVKLPTPTITVLPNGLTVMILEDHRLPLVTTQMLLYGSGEMHVPAGEAGLAATTAAQLTLGTANGGTTRTATQIASQVADLGATLSAGAGYGSSLTIVSAAGRSDNFAEWFGLQRDVVLHPAFPQDELDKYKARMKVALKNERASAQFLAAERFAQAVYGDFPAATISPTAAGLDALTRDELVAWHAQRYDPENAILAISGDVAPATLLPQLRSDFAGWAKTGASKAMPTHTAPATAKRIFLIDRPGSVQTTLALGNIAMDRKNPDYIGEVVLNQVLGANPEGRLFLNLREAHGYTYGVYSSFTANQYPGPWRAGGDVRTAVTDGSMTEMIKEINRLRNEKVPQGELDEYKRAVVASFALSLESPVTLLNFAVTQRYYGLPSNYWTAYPANVLAVSADEVQRLAQKYYDPNTMQVIAVGDGAVIKPILEKYGPVTEYGTDGKPRQ